MSAKMRAAASRPSLSVACDAGERLQRLEGEQRGRHEAHEMAERDIAVDALPAAVEDRRRQADARSSTSETGPTAARERVVFIRYLRRLRDDLPEALRLARLLAVGLHDPHALQRLRQHAAELADSLHASGRTRGGCGASAGRG